jgi:hypothetical protein
MNTTLATKIETDQAAAFAPLLEQIFAPDGADDKRVKAAKKCLEPTPAAFPLGRWTTTKPKDQ